MRLGEFLRELRTGKPTARPILWTQTTSHNGYMREKALAELSKSPAAEDWPYAVERLNDWVPQVSEQAELLVMKLIEDGHVAALVAWPEQLSALAGKSRAVSDNALSTIILALSVSGSLATMWPNLGRAFRERAVRTLLDHERLSELLTFRELKHLDPHSIQLILRERKVLPEDQISVLVNHPDPGTRKAALESAAALGSGEVELLRLALFDPSSRVRTTAQFLLGKRGIDARSIYLSKLDSDDLGTHIIEGLCDMATVEDLSLLRRLYDVSRSSPRTAIAKALCRLDDTTLLLPMLSDTSGRIRRMALVSAMKQPGGVSLENRQALFQSENPGVRKVGAQLLMSQSRWQSLIQILKFIGDDDESISSMALDYLRAWLRWASRSPTIPDPTTYKRAFAGAAYMEARLPEPVRIELKQILAWVSSRVHPT